MMRRILYAITNPYFAMYAIAKSSFLYMAVSYTFEKNGEKRLLKP